MIFTIRVIYKIFDWGSKNIFFLDRGQQESIIHIGKTISLLFHRENAALLSANERSGQDTPKSTPLCGGPTVNNDPLNHQ